jgi:hypothetical protein
MKIHKLYITLGLMLAFVLMFEFTAHADDANELTKITFSAPIQIPGKILPAGTYTFEQQDPNDNSHLVQIFNADRTVLYATLETVSADQMKPGDDTTIVLAQQEAGGPDVLVKWFYPGRTTGHEFIYSKQQEQSIAQARQETFVGNHLMPSGVTEGE